MATCQKLTDHFLTCPVCLEVFKEPCTLACDHTFCGQCVVSFTKTRQDAVKAKSLPCPFCDRLTKVPDPTGPIEEWAVQMKPSLLLLGLMDTIGPEAKDTTNCNLCHEGGETTPATTWCSVCDVSLCDACLKVHGRMPATRHHVTSDLSEEVMVKRRPKVMCQEHKDEVIKFYCRDCKKVLCQSCCIIYHRKCESVVSLESMLPEMRASLEAMKEALTKEIRGEEEQLVRCKTEYNDIQQTKSLLQSQIRSTTQKAIDAMKKKEKKLMDELDEVTDEQIVQVKAAIKTGDMAVQIHRQQSEFIDQALNTDSEMDIYTLYQSSRSEVIGSTGETGLKRRRIRTKIDFSRDLDKTLEGLQLGKIQTVKFDLLDAESTPVLCQTFDCRTSEDKTEMTMHDVAYMNVNGTDMLVVTDFKNTCVKLFFMDKSKPCYKQMGLPGKPHRVAKLENNKVAITLISKKIVTVAMTPDLSLLSSVTTKKQYIGLTALTVGTLAASSNSPPCIDILDMCGKMLRSISPLNNGQNMLQSPHMLSTTNKGNILVTDRGTKSVVCLTPQGDVVFNYSPTGSTALVYPCGIIGTETGDILVGDSGENKVILLRESGEFVRDILTPRDSLRSPCHLDYDNGSIYVSQNFNSIQVFTFK